MQEIKRIFISGITGGLSQILIRYISSQYKGCEIRGIARDCSLLREKEIEGITLKLLDFDLADSSRIDTLSEFLTDCELIIHTAAMKNVVECYNNSIGAVNSNIIGTENLINAASKAGVERFINISSDMAVEPLGVYGATKLIQASLIQKATEQGRIKGCNFRLGNIFALESNSIIHFFSNLYRKSGKLTITHPEMSRFGIKEEELAEAIFSVATNFIGGEVFAPKMKSYDILTICAAFSASVKPEIIGMREGEKIYETIISQGEGYKAYENEKLYILKPKEVEETDFMNHYKVVKCPPNFSLSSKNNPNRFSVDDIIALIDYLGLS